MSLADLPGTAPPAAHLDAEAVLEEHLDEVRQGPERLVPAAGLVLLAALRVPARLQTALRRS